MNPLTHAMPYDRVTLNSRILHFVQTDPLVKVCLKLRASVGIGEGKFAFAGLAGRELVAFEQLKERARIERHAEASSLQEETLGEVFTLWDWDAEALTWTGDYLLLNPSQVQVEPNFDTVLYRWRGLVLPSLETSDVFLDAKKLTVAVRRTAAHDLRGTSPLLPVLSLIMERATFVQELCTKRLLKELIDTDGTNEPDWRVLDTRYHLKRERMERLYHKHLFEPFAQANGIEVIPTMVWHEELAFDKAKCRERYMEQARNIAAAARTTGVQP